jgi:hypothetical protein
MFRKQMERHRQEIEEALGRALGAPTSLELDTVLPAEDAPSSLADQETEQAKDREERIVRQSREDPAVLAAVRILGGAVEQVRVLEEQSLSAGAGPLQVPALSPEEGDET